MRLQDRGCVWQGCEDSHFGRVGVGWHVCVRVDVENPNILASCSSDKTIKIWDIESGACLSTLDVDGEVCSVSFSPDGEFIAAGYGYPGNAIQIFKAQTGEKFQSPLTGHRYVPSL